MEFEPIDYELGKRFGLLGGARSEQGGIEICRLLEVGSDVHGFLDFTGQRPTSSLASYLILELAAPTLDLM